MQQRTVTSALTRFTAAITLGALVAVQGMPATALAADTTPAAAAAPKAPSKAETDAARKAYKEGEAAFGKGDFKAAEAGFAKAFATVPSPHALYWLAMAIDKQGDRPKDALAALEKYLADPGFEKLGADKVAGAKARRAELAASPGEVVITTDPPGAMVSIDGQAQPGETPLVLKLPGGEHTILVTYEGYEKQEYSVQVLPFGSIESKVRLKAMEAPPAPAPAPAPVAPAPAPAEPAPTPAKQEASRLPAYITLGVAGAGAVVGTVFGLQALSAKSDYDDKPTADGADKVERNALIADMAFGVALTLGVTGVVLLLTGNSDDDSAAPADTARLRQAPRRTSRVQVAPYATFDGGGAAARWTF